MPNKRSPIPPHQAATVERLYSDGMSIKKIALAIGRHEKVVSECVKAAGIFRTPLPAAKDKPKRVRKSRAKPKATPYDPFYSMCRP